MCRGIIGSLALALMTTGTSLASAEEIRVPGFSTPRNERSARVKARVGDETPKPKKSSSWSVPKVSMPKFSIPKVSMPKFAMPKFAMPKVDLKIGNAEFSVHIRF